MNNRLLFAAGRGARIQTQYTYPRTYWDKVNAFRTDNFYKYRIMPSDKHLEYGPVSTALRSFGVNGSWGTDMHSRLAALYYREALPYPFVLASEMPHAQWFALMLSEEMCDDGL